jgi:aspartate dehydrogenase
VARHVLEGTPPHHVVLGFVSQSSRAGLPSRQFTDVEAMLRARPTVVVEAAGHSALRDYGSEILKRGIDLVTLSAGALADDVLRDELTSTANRNKAKLVIPSGAIGALDLLSAASVSGVTKVEIEQRKPPVAFMPADSAAMIREPRLIFEGTVREVVSRYPLTTNVAAAVALCSGLGLDGTTARVIADPSVGANQVTLNAQGAFGHMTLELSNSATENPRTSAIASLSIVASLGRLASPLVIPG